MKVVPISVSRDVPAPSVVHHRYVIDPQGIIRNAAFKGARHCDVSVVYYLLGPRKRIPVHTPAEMSVLGTIRQSYVLRDNLKSSYKLLVYGPPVLVGIACLPLGGLACAWLAGTLGVSDSLPIKDQPIGMWFVAIILFVMLGALFLGLALGTVALALGLRVLGGWSWAKVHALLVKCEAPNHWLKTSAS
jgi:hypothetical protein